MASCKHCNIPIEERDSRIYCEVCFGMLAAVYGAPDRCCNCHCPLEIDRKDIYELTNEQGELREFCSVCFELAAAICASPYFVAIAWAELERKKAGKHCDDD